VATAVLVAVGALGGTGDRVDGSPGQPDAVIVGDSLTARNATYIAPTLRNAGLDVGLEALGARQIAVSFDWYGYRDSGIERIRTLRRSGVDPALWVIQLGTNDLRGIRNCGCADPVVFAGALIDRLLAELPPTTPVAWVTVLDRSDFGVSATFNEALRRRAATNHFLRLVDWASLSLERPDWYGDAVHPNAAGVVRFTKMYVDEIRALLAAPPGPPPQQPGLQRAVRLGVRVG